MVDHVNCVAEGERSARRRLDFSFNVNMANPARRDDEKKEGADSSDWLHKGKKRHITKDQVKDVRYQRPLSAHLLKKYRYQYKQRLQYESEGEEYKHRTGRIRRRREETRDHWHWPFFKYCWDSSMSRLPTISNCPECAFQRCSVFERLGPVAPQHGKAESLRD